MAILRFDPFRDPFRDLDRITNQLMSGTRMPHGMPMDVYKCDNAWHIEMDLPGIDLESIDLIVERNALTVRAALPSTSRNGNRCLGSRVTRDGVAPRASREQIVPPLEAATVALTEIAESAREGLLALAVC